MWGRMASHKKRVLRDKQRHLQHLREAHRPREMTMVRRQRGMARVQTLSSKLVVTHNLRVNLGLSRQARGVQLPGSLVGN
jgi:hypothetical protein